ncbi:MAG: phosphorylase [Pleurocapsa sp. MO_192.B19]|nr:phosphorylase [Pleurocapsa sp. MO_192.B19]
MSIDTIVVPQGAEYQAVCRGLKKANSKNIQAIAIPLGMQNVRQHLANSRLKSNSSQGVAILGLCGSLSPKYSVGDAVLYQNCWDVNRACIETSTELTQMIQHKLSVDLVTGLTSARPICQAAEKLQFSQIYPVSVVDMEGYGYLQELQHQKIAATMLRVVSDDLTGDIPNLDSAIDPNGNLQTWPMAIAFLQQPLAAIRLIKGSLRGLKTLQQITTQLFS